MPTPTMWDFFANFVRWRKRKDAKIRDLSNSVATSDCDSNARRTRQVTDVCRSTFFQNIHLLVDFKEVHFTTWQSRRQTAEQNTKYESMVGQSSMIGYLSSASSQKSKCSWNEQKSQPLISKTTNWRRYFPYWAPLHLTGCHWWSRTFSPMDHRWTTGGPPMPGATFWYGHRWTTGGHRWKWKSQKRPMRLKTLFSFVYIIQTVVPPLRSNAFPSMDHMIIKFNTLYMSTK